MSGMINLIKLARSFGDHKVLDAIDLSITRGSFVAIVGPSGCGKSTLLNLLAGIDRPTSGTVDLPLDARVGYMLQDALMLPWRSLSENGLLGAEVREGRNGQSRALLAKYFMDFDLGDAMDVPVAASSGGMKQRVALIRTLLTEPSILLLDEPFSSLDFDVKLKIQRSLIDYHEKHGTTTLIVTHDIEDAIALADEIIVLSTNPATVKKVIKVDLGPTKRDPIEARKSSIFAHWFAVVWDEMKSRNNA
jgi:NitT/TauT family transport system ATP-binding protein